jgi:hypothetical protein
MTAPATLPPPDGMDAWVTGQTRAGKRQLLDEMTPDELRAIARHCLEYVPNVVDRAIAERLRARRKGNKAATAKGTT